MLRHHLHNQPLHRLLTIPDMLPCQLQITIPQPAQHLIQPRIAPRQSRLNLPQAIRPTLINSLHLWIGWCSRHAFAPLLPIRFLPLCNSNEQRATTRKRTLTKNPGYSKRGQHTRRGLSDVWSGEQERYGVSLQALGESSAYQLMHIDKLLRPSVEAGSPCPPPIMNFDDRSGESYPLRCLRPRVL